MAALATGNDHNETPNGASRDSNGYDKPRGNVQESGRTNEARQDLRDTLTEVNAKLESVESDLAPTILSKAIRLAFP